MAEATDSIKSTFNSLSLGGVLKFTFQAVVIGIVVGGLIDFTLFHNHPIGKAMIAAVNEPLLGVYDAIAKGIGMPELARSASEVALSTGACTMQFDEMGVPIPCA